MITKNGINYFTLGVLRIKVSIGDMIEGNRIIKIDKKRREAICFVDDKTRAVYDLIYENS